MTNENYTDLIMAIESIANGLERLAYLSMDLKTQLDDQIDESFRDSAVV